MDNEKYHCGVRKKVAQFISLFIVNNIKYLGNNSGGGYDWGSIWKVIKVDSQLRHHKHHWQIVGIVQKGGVMGWEKKKCSLWTWAKKCTLVKL